MSTSDACAFTGKRNSKVKSYRYWPFAPWPWATHTKYEICLLRGPATQQASAMKTPQTHRNVTLEVKDVFMHVDVNILQRETPNLGPFIRRYEQFEPRPCDAMVTSYGLPQVRTTVVTAVFIPGLSFLTRKSSMAITSLPERQSAPHEGIFPRGVEPSKQEASMSLLFCTSQIVLNQTKDKTMSPFCMQAVQQAARTFHKRARSRAVIKATCVSAIEWRSILLHCDWLACSPLLRLAVAVYLRKLKRRERIHNPFWKTKTRSVVCQYADGWRWFSASKRLGEDNRNILCARWSDGERRCPQTSCFGLWTSSFPRGESFFF